MHDLTADEASIRAPKAPVGNHLISDTRPHQAEAVWADFGDSLAASFLLCLLMLQKWTVR